MLNGDREDWGAEAYWGGMGGEVGGNKRGDKREKTRDGIAWNGGEKGMYGAFLYLEL